MKTVTNIEQNRGTTVCVIARPFGEGNFLCQIRTYRANAASPRVLSFHGRVPRAVRKAIDSLALSGDEVAPVLSPIPERPWIVVVNFAAPAQASDVAVITWPLDQDTPEALSFPVDAAVTPDSLASLFPDSRILGKTLVSGASAHWAEIARACAIPVTDGQALTNFFS